MVLSKRYRSAIKRSIKMLEKNEFDAGQSPVSVQQLGEELCSFGLLWSLVEAMTFRPSRDKGKFIELCKLSDSDNLIVMDLLEWARECFPSTQSLIPNSSHLVEPSFLGTVMEELMLLEQPENHASYWNAVN